MKFAFIIPAIMLFVVFMASSLAYAHYPHASNECASTEALGSQEECLLEHRNSAKEIKLVDMFFSEGVHIGGNNADPNEIPLKMEVEPGDGRTLLVAVLANSGPFEITGMRGWLSLPLGFEAAGKSVGEPAFDTYDLGILPGATFVFEFPVEVTEDTRVGWYDAILHVEYFEARNLGLNYRDFQVEFQLPGKNVLDAIAVDSVLEPSTRNTALIEITNDGSAPASGVIINLHPQAGVGRVETETIAEQVNQIIILGKKVFNIGIIPPQSKAVIDPVLYVNPELADSRQNLQFTITYFDSYGQRTRVTTLINFLVAGSTTQSIDFTVTTNRPVIQTITETPFIVTLLNTGEETAKSVEVTINTPSTATVALNQEVPDASRSPLSIIGSDGYSRASEIPAGESIDVQVILFASEEAVNTAFQLPVTISYLDPEGGIKRIQRQVSVYIQGTINLRVYDLGITYIANEPNLSGFLLNEGTNMALFTTVELVENENGIRQVGNPQYLGDLTANSPLPFNVPVKFEGNGTDSYPVKVRIMYKDDLRIAFEEEIEGTVLSKPPIIEEENQDGFIMTSPVGLLAGVGVAGVVGYFFVNKKRKNKIRSREKGAYNNDEDDNEFLGDSKE